MKNIRIILILLTFFSVILPQKIIAQSDTQIDFFNLVQSSPQNLFEHLFDAYETIKLKDAWDVINSRNLDLTPVKIGIVDSGIDASGVRHQEFRGVKLGNTPPDAKTDSETQGHGTQIAGIIGANNVSATSSANYRPFHMNGILSGAKNLDYTIEVRKPRFFGTFFSVDAMSVFFEIGKLSKENVDVVNLSNGTRFFSFFDPLKQYFGRAFSRNPNILFVLAAGNTRFEFLGENISNDVSFEYPANMGNDFDNVITVGATRLDDSRASFSNFGNAVGVAAPGENIYAPAPRGRGDFGAPSADYEKEFPGTSASAPLVTGVAGLIKAIKPLLTPAEIKDILTRSADPLFAPTGSDEEEKSLGSGCTGTPPTGMSQRGCRLNALAAVCDPLVLGVVQGCPNSIPPSPFVLHVTNGIQFNDDNVSAGEIKANGGTGFRTNNVHQGNVTTNVLSSFGINNRIIGDVGYNILNLRYPGTFPAITGTITTPTPPPNVVLPDILPFPAGTTTTTITEDTMLFSGNHGNIIVTNGATLTLLDGVYNFDTFVLFNPDTSLRFSAGSIVNMNGTFFASINVHVLPTTLESSARLSITTRGDAIFNFGNMVSADFRTGGVVLLLNDNVLTGNIRGGVTITENIGIGVIFANDRNRINVPPLPSLSSLTTTNPTYPTSTTPPLDTLNWMEQNIMTTLLENNVATSTRVEIERGFEEARAVLQNNP